MDASKSIMIVGVGGQGSLLASRIMGSLLMAQGFDVKVSEVHGMSQRGGSVVTYVRYGEKVSSPVVELGEADVIVAFELLEAARWLPYLSRGGRLLACTQRISPMPVITGAAQYPENLVQKIAGAGADITAVNALALAEEAGSAKAVNVVMLGLLSRVLDIPESAWLTALEKTVPARFLELNKRAFMLGRKEIENN